MLGLHEFLLVITVFLPPKKIHHKIVVPVPVTTNELYRTHQACLQRGYELDHVMKQKHRWSCHEIDQD
jgi:hypothetical protein